MDDVIITGASRGIGRALAIVMASADVRLVLVARDEERLAAVASEIRDRGGYVVLVPGDLGTIESARRLGVRLAETLSPGATLVHNAGIWPYRRSLNADGLEEAFAVNCIGPAVMQEALLVSGCLVRIMLVSAGLAVKGRFDAERTPSGHDFSMFRTYATTKLCFALAMRDVAKEHPELDVVVLHPGVVRTDLGRRDGWMGVLLRMVKRGWEAPETCASRLARILARPRWSAPGEAVWMFEENEQAWPDAMNDETTRRQVYDTLARWRPAVS